MTSRLRPRATLVLFASLLLSSLGCPSDDTPSDAETGTETETGTGDGDGDPGDGDGDPGTCSTPGVYGDCAGGLDACMTDGPKQCVLDSQNMPSIAVCGRPCDDVCDCWEAPAGSEAAPMCVSLAPGDDGTCILDCSGGAACPNGMICTTSPGSDIDLCVFQQ